MSARSVRSAAPASASKRFDLNTKAMDVIKGVDLKGYEVIVTGGSSGIGTETVKALATAGARVTVTARDLEKAKPVIEELKKETKNDKIELELMDLSSLKSVKEFVKRYISLNRPLNILINNAGIMACPLSYTEDGFEMQFGTNHMGHFALTIGLIPALKAGVKAIGKSSRVVNVSSLAHGRQDIDFNDINYKTREYEPWLAYAQSKTANILFTVELNKRYSGEGIYANCLTPGAVATNLQRHMTHEEKIQKNIIDENGKPAGRFRSIDIGANTNVWAAVAKELENRGGLYLENCSISSETTMEEAYKNFTGYLPHAMNQENAKKLWELSEKWLENPPK